MAETSGFAPGTLWDRIVERARRARMRGALQPIETEMHIVKDRGAQFQVRVVSSLVRKKQASIDARRNAEDGKPVDPFLPYEQDLFVADVSETHLCLLNKYNVIDHHLLIVTRAFEPQEAPLTERDFVALWTCMKEYDALGFYNSGPNAGASQPHKHLQLVPLPLGPTRLPIDPLLATDAPPSKITRIDTLPFAHAYVRLDVARLHGTAAAPYTLDLYRRLLAATRLAASPPAPLPDTLPPYNLLATRDFLWLVPRSRSHHSGVPVNAMGFAGSFFSAQTSAVDTIRNVGPLTLLKEVGVA